MKWITDKTDHVDIETGEKLKETELNKYYKIKTIKKILINDKQTIGHIKHTTEWRRSPKQTELPF
jgi:hypothetical protein